LQQINELLLENSHYYLADHSSLGKEGLKRYRGNWLGVKLVGKKHPDQTMKMNLNSMANYLSLSKDYTVKDEEKELIKLEHLKKNDDKYKITDRHKELRKKALFWHIPKYKNKLHYVFMVNEEYERDIEEMSKRDDLKRQNEYISKQRKIEDVKENALHLHKEIGKLKTETVSLKKTIKESYSLLKTSKDSSLVSDLIKLTKKLKQNQGEIAYLEDQIISNIDDYKILTNEI